MKLGEKSKLQCFCLTKTSISAGEELDKIKEICDTLATLEINVQYLCKENTNLVPSEKVIIFAVKKRSVLKAPFGNALLESFKKRIQKRRNIEFKSSIWKCFVEKL